MNTLRKHSSYHFLFACLCVALVFDSYPDSALAQRTASKPFESFFDEFGIMVDGAYVPGLEVTEEQRASNPLVFEGHTDNHLPILLPDGVTQATFEDLANVTGTMEILELGEQGTQVSIDVQGLIPNGVYSAYISLFEQPGFTPDFAHWIGGTAIGYSTDDPPADPFSYDDNVFVADESGAASLELVQPPVSLSMIDTGIIADFKVPAYVLDPPIGEFDVILNYHIDGNGTGPRPGMPEGLDTFDETWVGYSVAYIDVVPEPPSFSPGALACLTPLVLRRSREMLLQ